MAVELYDVKLNGQRIQRISETKRYTTGIDTVGVTQNATYNGTSNFTIEYTVEIGTTRRSKRYIEISGTIIR